jgi:hypothetical protein
LTLFSRDDLVRLLIGAGFEIEGVFGDFHGQLSACRPTCSARWTNARRHRRWWRWSRERSSWFAGTGAI